MRKHTGLLGDNGWLAVLFHYLHALAWLFLHIFVLLAAIPACKAASCNAGSCAYTTIDDTNTAGCSGKS